MRLARALLAALFAAAVGVGPIAAPARAATPPPGYSLLDGARQGAYLAYGSSGPAVSALQAALDALGYGVASTGVFDGPTYAAVVTFQRSAGIGVDGVVGPETMQALDRALGLAAGAPPAASASMKILVIGDSHTVGTFGRTLDADLRTLSGVAVATYGVGGSSSDSWFKSHTVKPGVFYEHDENDVVRYPRVTPRLADLLQSFAPDVTIVALGSNQLGMSRQAAADAVRRMVDAIAASGSICVWVGPPRMRRFRASVIDTFYLALQDVATATGCSVIDSRLLTYYPNFGGDGVHFDALGRAGKAIAKAWADGAFDAFVHLPAVVNLEQALGLAPP